MTISSDCFSFETHSIKIQRPPETLSLNMLAMKLCNSYFIWIGDAQAKFTGLSLSIPGSGTSSTVNGATVYHSNSTTPSSRSIPELSLANKLSKKLGCTVYLSLSVTCEFLDNWDVIDPVSRRPLSHEIQEALLKSFDTFFSQSVDPSL
uniref:Proteasome assembly chaperone 4 n=2 Tax=Schistocephalus solidus TaxID=70667 RepID=A0A0X3PIV2_SCHSO